MNVDKMALERAKYISRHVIGNFLDVGANTMLLKQFVKGKYTAIDIDGGPTIATAEQLPFKSNTFDTVVMSEVIEHIFLEIPTYM